MLSSIWFEEVIMRSNSGLYLCLFGMIVGCSDVTKTEFVVASTDMELESLDGRIVNEAQMDMMRPVVPPTPFPDAQMMVRDQGVPLVDADIEPDSEQPMGEPCDPREWANACDEGFFCLGTSEFEGTCEPGTACDVLNNEGCTPPDGTYCHLSGQTSLCTDEGLGIAGDNCRDANNGSLPCADGYVCNGSLCTQACDPNSQNPCDDGGRCADVSSVAGQTLGFCVERGCNIYTGRGCGVREFCRFRVNTDGLSVGSCDAEPQMALGIGESCEYGVGDDCEQGLICVQAPTGDVCRQLCDSGGYQVTCPPRQVCVEALQNSAGIIRGVGVCITNQ